MHFLEAIPVARTMVARRRQRFILLWMLVATWECLPYFCTPVTGTTAAQWTLYSGLSLSWNEASMFCKSLGGHLPVLNSRLRFNGFDVTVTKWRKANLVMQDIWTGLFSRNPKVAADVWEAKCLAHPDRLVLWGANEPDNIGRHLCARYKLTTGKLHTRSCGDSLSVVCEFDAGNCHYSTASGLVPKLQRNESLSGTTMNSCWDQCMKYPPTATGQECVGAVYSSGKCTGYVGDTLVFAWSLTGDLSVITMAKECFDVNVNRCYNSYTYVDKSSKPRPAGDPCNPFRRSILLVVPTSTCRQTTTTSTQTQPSVLTTILATGEHSSEKLQTQATWPTTEISTQEVSETSATPTVSGSTSLESSLQTTTERAADISRSDETTAENTSNERTEELTTGIDLRDSETSTVFDDGRNGSSSGNVLSTRGGRRLMCPCMRFNPNVSSWLPTMHRNTTSRYRRSHTSQWGSPSVYTSTCSATFVIVVGVGGFLFVVCDINRFAGVCGKNPVQQSRRCHRHKHRWR